MKDTFWNILTFKGGIEFKAPLMIEQAEELMLMAKLGKLLKYHTELWKYLTSILPIGLSPWPVGQPTGYPGMSR